MNKLSKILKLTGILCLIFLACLGVGLGGAAPVLPKNKERFIETGAKIELVEVKQENLTSTNLAVEIKV